MKKLLFAFIATVAMTFAACGGQTASVQTATDSDSVVVDSNVKKNTHEEQKQRLNNST